MTTAATLLVLATALVVGPGRAEASWKAWCQDSYPTTTTVLWGPVYAAFEWTAGASDTFVTVCYGDTSGSDPTNALGGAVHVKVHKVSADTYRTVVACLGDPGMLAEVDCSTTITTTVSPSTSTTPPSAGVATSGYLYSNGVTVTLGNTGAQTGSITTTTAGNPQVRYSGTCTTVAGITPPVGTTCSTHAVDAQIGAGDGPNSRTGGWTSTCLVTGGATCHLYAPRAFVEAFDDPYNATSAKVLDVPVFNDPGRVCVGFGC